MVLHLLNEPQMSIARRVRALANVELGEFARSIKVRLGDFPLAEILGQPEAGSLLPQILEPLLHQLHREGSSPISHLDPNLDAFALHSTTNMIRLVLAPHLSPPHLALLMCIGATLAAAAQPNPADAGRALSAWTRVIRMPVKRHGP